MARILSIEEQDELDRLVKEERYCELLSMTGILYSKEGSTGALEAGYSQFERYFKRNMGKKGLRKLHEVLGTANALMLRFGKAADHFREAGSKEKLKEMLEVGKIYGRYDVISKMKPDKKEYQAFLKDRALPLIPMCRDEEGFYLKEDALENIIKEIGEDRGALLEEAVEKLDKGGSLNIPKKMLLAELSGNVELAKKFQEEYKRLENGNRRDIDAVLERHLRGHGMKLRKKLQKGDTDEFFPIASNLYFAKDADKKRVVLKEHLRLYVDFTRTDGYSVEKEILEELDHENIVKCLGSFEAEGIEFLKLEFIEGHTLARHTKPDDLLHPKETMRIIKTLCDVIDYIHSKDILYMDIKDKNVMYDGKNVKLVDFGMAQKIEGELTEDTYATSLLSTPKYVAPEMGTRFRSYKASDVFQLGVLLHEMITGYHPLARYNFTEGDEHRESEIMKYALSNIHNERDENHELLKSNAGLNSLLGEMLDKDYKKRPAAKEVSERLTNLIESYQGGEPDVQ